MASLPQPAQLKTTLTEGIPRPFFNLVEKFLCFERYQLGKAKKKSRICCHNLRRKACVIKDLR